MKKQFFAALSLLLCIYAQAQIGIGTTTPNSTLDVRGSLSTAITTFSSNTTAAASDNMFLFTGTSAATLTLPTAVGITGREYWVKNISSNSSTLTIATTSAQTIDGIGSWTLTQTNKAIRLISNGTNWYAASESLPGSSGTPWILGGNNVSSLQNIGTTSNYDVPFITNNTEKVRIDVNGKVGIGTSSPTANLHVVNSGSVTNTIAQFLTPGLATTNATYLKLGKSLTNGDEADIFYNWTGANNAANYLGFSFYGKSVYMILNNAGNVAIGTTTFNATYPERFIVDAGATGNTNYQNVIVGKGNTNSYAQLNIQNMYSGSAVGTIASSDVIATSDNGSETVNYIDMGINTSGNNSTGVLGGANTAYLYSTGNDFAIGNGTNLKNLNFFTTTGGVYTERMRIDANGNVGIANSSPSEKLDVTGNIEFSGALKPGGNAGAVGTFLISTGSSSAPTWFDASGFAWVIDGNTVGAEKKFGTKDGYALPFITNNTEKMRISSSGDVGIGTSTFNGTYPEQLIVDAGAPGTVGDYQNVIVGKGNTNSYAQLNIQNIYSGGATPNIVSSDVVATANNGNESVNYIDMGINGGSNASTGVYGGANTAYLYSTGNDFALGNGTANKNLLLFTGGTASINERVRIDGSGNVGIGTTSPTALLHLKAGTATASTAPLKLTAGTNLTSPEAGAIEFDGVNTYITNETTAGRGAIPVEQHFLLSAAGSTISTIANFFGTTSNIPLVSGGYYEIEIDCYFLKTTAGTVTWTFTNSAAPASMDLHYDFSAATGIVSAPAATYVIGDQYNLTTTAPTVVSASLTTAVNHHAHFKIILLNNTGTSLKIQATCSAGTITPGIGSRWYCKRISTSNVGAFAN
jgi:hypothetical protein